MQFPWNAGAVRSIKPDVVDRSRCTHTRVLEAVESSYEIATPAAPRTTFIGQSVALPWRGMGEDEDEDGGDGGRREGEKPRHGR